MIPANHCSVTIQTTAQIGLSHCSNTIQTTAQENMQNTAQILFKPLPSDHSNHCSDTIQTTTKWPFKPLLMITFKPLLWYHSNHCSDHYSSIISKWFPIFYHYFLGDVCDYTIQLNTVPTSLASAYREFKNTASDCMAVCSENRDICVGFAYRSSDKQCFRFFSSLRRLSFTTDSDYIFFEKRCIRPIGKYVFNINKKKKFM